MTTHDDHLDKDIRQRMQADLDYAHDYDPQDPLFGLDRRSFGGPQLERRTVLRLLAAAGGLTAFHLMPGAVRPASAASGGTLTAGWSGVGEIRTLDPAQIDQVLEFQISSNVLSGLTHINPQLIAEGDLAKDWQISEDGTEYVFNLREGVTFHNGDPFTADDVIYTYNRSKDPNQSKESRVLSGVDGMEKLSDTKVRIKLKAPSASFLVKTLERSSGRAMTIVSRGGIEKLGPQQYGLTPVGTGPFKITEHTMGQGLTLERFENYYDPERPKLDKVIIKPIIEPEPLAAAIEAGDIQLIGGNPIAPELTDRFTSNSDLKVSIVGGPGFQSLWLNPWRDPMKVPDFNKPLDELMKEKGFMVRLAIAKALDRDLYIKQAQFGRGTPAFGTINPAMRYYYDEDLANTSNQKFDADAARKLLADAGYPDGKGFPKLKVVLDPAAKREVTVIANILKRNLNIELELDIKDFPVLIDQFDTMEWDLVRVGSGGDFDPDDGLVDWMETSSKFNGPTRDKSKLSFGYFSDKEVDDLTEKERVTPDPASRKALVQKANKITSDKVASVFIFHPADILVYRKNVNFPDESRIPGLVDLDRTSIS